MSLTVKQAGSLGGKASALSLTKEERIARAKKAVAEREAKKLSTGENKMNGE